MEVRRRRKLRTLIVGILKDKASHAKALALLSPARVAAIRATPHGDTSAPPERRVAAVLARGDDCVDALMARLGGTGSAAVALKCLVVAHSVLSRGSAVLHHRLSSSSSGRNALNLSSFRDRSGAWELSAWVRWYARAVEQSLAVSRVLGHSLYITGKDSSSSSSSPPSSELLTELDALADFAERASEAPEESLEELRKNGLVYEVLRLVGEDYKLVQREISVRGKELGDRIKGIDDDEDSINGGELTRLVSGLKRIEDCKERLVSIFLRKKRDDEFWGLIGGLKIKAVQVMIEKRLLMDGHEIISNENSTRFLNNPFVEPGRFFLLPNSNALTISN